MRVVRYALGAILLAGTAYGQPVAPYGPGYAYTGPSRIAFSGTSVGNGADLTEDTLFTATIPASTLASAGNRIHIVAGGVLAATTDAKTVRVKFGGTNLSGVTASATGAAFWFIDTWVVKTASNAQSYNANGITGFSNSGLKTGTLTVTDTSAITVLVTGQNTTNSAAGSITMQYVAIDLVP